MISNIVNIFAILIIPLVYIYWIANAYKKKQTIINLSFSKIFWGAELISFALSFTVLLSKGHDYVAIIDLIGICVSLYLTLFNKYVSIEWIYKLKKTDSRIYEAETDYYEEIDSEGEFFEESREDNCTDEPEANDESGDADSEESNSENDASEDADFEEDDDDYGMMDDIF